MRYNERYTYLSCDFFGEKKIRWLNKWNRLKLNSIVCKSTYENEWWKIVNLLVACMHTFIMYWNAYKILTGGGQFMKHTPTNTWTEISDTMIFSILIEWNFVHFRQSLLELISISHAFMHFNAERMVFNNSPFNWHQIEEENILKLNNISNVPKHTYSSTHTKCIFVIWKRKKWWTNSDGDFDLSQLIKQQIKPTNNELNLTHVSWKVLNDNVVLCIYGR